jgi:hypothetical protein
LLCWGTTVGDVDLFFICLLVVIDVLIDVLFILLPNVPDTDSAVNAGRRTNRDAGRK